MNRQPVKSSQIRSVGHDASTNTLEVEFKNGSTYQYQNVPLKTATAMTQAKSVGSFFHSQIKPMGGKKV